MQDHPSSDSPKSKLLPVLLTERGSLELPVTPSLGSINFLGQLAELRKLAYSQDYWFITEDILKDTNQQPDREIKGREREVPNKRTSVLTEFRAWHGGTWNCSGTPIWKSLNPVLWVFMESLLDRHI